MKGARTARSFPSDAWGAFFAYLSILYVVVCVAYYVFGASGVSFGGAGVGFEREKDRFVLRVDDARGFSLHGSGPPALVRLKRAPFPLWPLCGRCELDGAIVPMVTHLDGDWAYTDFPMSGRPAAYNLATRETVTVAAPPSAPLPAGAVVPEYAARGLALADEKKVTPRALAGRYEDGRAVKESCLVFQFAFWALYGVMFLWLGGELVRWVARRRG